MKIVLDTNVLIAALIAKGVCSAIVGHCLTKHTVFTSDFILDELHGHLTGKFKRSEEDANEAVALLTSQMKRVEPIILPQPTCRDEDDDQILGTAVAAQADCIITGDKDLLILATYEGIEIVKPGDFASFEVKLNGNDV